MLRSQHSSMLAPCWRLTWAHVEEPTWLYLGSMLTINMSPCWDTILIDLWPIFRWLFQEFDWLFNEFWWNSHAESSFTHTRNVNSRSTLIRVNRRNLFGIQWSCLLGHKKHRRASRARESPGIRGFASARISLEAKLDQIRIQAGKLSKTCVI